MCSEQAHHLAQVDDKLRKRLLKNRLSAERSRQRKQVRHASPFFFFFVTLVTGPRKSLGLKLSDTRVYEPQIRFDLAWSVSPHPR